MARASPERKKNEKLKKEMGRKVLTLIFVHFEQTRKGPGKHRKPFP